MAFGPYHYVPVLKVKSGEKTALQRIAANLRTRITPLFEIVERKRDKKGIAAHLDTAFEGLAESAGAYPRCFLDTREIEPDGPQAAAAVFARAAKLGMAFTPVTGLSRTVDVAAAFNNRTHGLALRLTKLEFDHGGLADRIETFLGLHEIHPNDIDLIIDLGAVENLVPEGAAALTHAFMAEVPHHNLWRTFTVAACAFPMSMGGVARHSHGLVERADWIAWRDRLHADRHRLSRLPTFGDYAIQHPAGVEGFDPRIMPISASIRYTTDEHWLLVKGESTRSTQPGAQFPQLATRLVYGHLRSHFAGIAHCDGCASMKAAADGAPKLGSPGVWRKLGTIHHISKVMQELGALTWP